MNNLNKRNEFVEKNMGLVYMVAKKFLGRGVEFEDVVQIGSVGLIKASERFNPDLNIKFSTYAVTMIIGEIKRYFRDDGIVKIPRNIKETGMKIIKASEELKLRLDREPTITELSEFINVDTEKIVEALGAMQPYESLSKENENSASIYETIADDNEADIEIEDEIFLKELLLSLNSRLRQIIILRFYKDKTQSEVGDILKISQVQVSRLEKKALEILRSSGKLTV